MSEHGRASRAGYIVVGALACVAALATLLTLASRSANREILFVDWIIDFDTASPGPVTADEAFQRSYVQSLWDQGRRVDRLYLGRRVSLDVYLSKRTAGVAPGAYTVYGDVRYLDVPDKRLSLERCRFEPRDAK